MRFFSCSFLIPLLLSMGSVVLLAGCADVANPPGAEVDEEVELPNRPPTPDSTESITEPDSPADAPEQPDSKPPEEAVPDNGPPPETGTPPKDLPPAEAKQTDDTGEVKGPLGTDLSGLKPPDGEEPVAAAPTARERPKPLPAPPEAKGLKRVEGFDLWLDHDKKQVVMAGEICLREGPLEMFACLKETKEHESLIAINTIAFHVHAALLRLGAKQGRPVQFRPEYVKATGSEIDVTVFWTDAEGKRKSAPAQHWIRNVDTNKELAAPWVFGGSGFFKTAAGENYYLAEDGDLICISNFASAMLDLPIESSQSNDGLLFEAWTDRIPERGTQVAVVLKPVLKKNAEGEQPPADKPPADKPEPGTSPKANEPEPEKTPASADQP